MKKTTVRLSAILLAALLLACGLALPSSAGAATAVLIGGSVTLDAATPYLVNGAAAASGTLGSGGCTAYLNTATDTLNLRNYNGGGIQVAAASGRTDLTIALTKSCMVVGAAPRH